VQVFSAKLKLFKINQKMFRRLQPVWSTKILMK